MTSFDRREEAFEAKFAHDQGARSLGPGAAQFDHPEAREHVRPPRKSCSSLCAAQAVDSRRRSSMWIIGDSFGNKLTIIPGERIIGYVDPISMMVSRFSMAQS